MADPLPPLPALPELGDPQFGEKIALWNAVQSLYSAAALDRQTAALIAARVASEAVLAQMVSAQAAAEETPADRYRDYVKIMLSQDRDAVVRGLVGTGNIHEWAKQLVQKGEELYPSAPPA